jgi:hypothetical protein
MKKFVIVMCVLTMLAGLAFGGTENLLVRQGNETNGGSTSALS